MSVGVPDFEAPKPTPPAAESANAVPGARLLTALRGFTEGVLGSVQSRFELLSVELQEEKQRFVQTLIWSGVLLFGAMLSVSFVSLAIVAACWDTAARVPVVVSLAAVYSIATLGVGLKLRRLLTRTAPPFAATIEELKADRECIRTHL